MEVGSSKKWNCGHCFDGAGEAGGKLVAGKSTGQSQILHTSDNSLVSLGMTNVFSHASRLCVGS
jgi:hypothetical protein